MGYIRAISKDTGISIKNGILWVLIWLGFMLMYTSLDILVWRRMTPTYERYLNLGTIILCMVTYWFLLTEINHMKFDILGNVSLQGILLAIGCSILFYLLLDNCLDPIFEGLFTASEENYQEMIQQLGAAPFINLVQVCVLAPIIEEVLMRGYVLAGLSINYGKGMSLLISACLFALLHFNMVQTLSAFICGIVLGVLYLQTGSVFCCILAHMGYNLISYFTMILPILNK